MRRKTISTLAKAATPTSGLNGWSMAGFWSPQPAKHFSIAIRTLKPLGDSVAIRRFARPHTDPQAACPQKLGKMQTEPGFDALEAPFDKVQARLRVVHPLRQKRQIGVNQGKPLINRGHPRGERGHPPFEFSNAKAERRDV